MCISQKQSTWNKKKNSNKNSICLNERRKSWIYGAHIYIQGVIKVEYLERIQMEYKRKLADMTLCYTYLFEREYFFFHSFVCCFTLYIIVSSTDCMYVNKISVNPRLTPCFHKIQSHVTTTSNYTMVSPNYLPFSYFSIFSEIVSVCNAFSHTEITLHNNNEKKKRRRFIFLRLFKRFVEKSFLLF